MPSGQVRPRATRVRASPSADPAQLLTGLRSELTRVGDPGRAAAMQRYMKSSMPYHGVPAPALRGVCRALFAELAFADAQVWSSSVLALWTGARFREERYAAVALSGHRAARAFQQPDALGLYERLIVEGAWWDFVDELAVHRLGPILRAHPLPTRRIMRRFSRDADMWKRRSSILCQIAFKQETDLGLLYECIRPSMASKEFFLRKAIGWALRQYAWTDAREVIRFVKQHAQDLSPLTKREALKNVMRAGLLTSIP